MTEKCQALFRHPESVRPDAYGVSMGTVLCVVCSTRDAEAFADTAALLCAECETRWAVCLDCDEPYLIAEATGTLRCEPCLVVLRSPARIAA
ncbi:MAG TPA: hypothetical protein VE824_06280 [Gaiellales bacterium]|nr:hypothetical protein [Gaiellales bacterium]